MKRYKDNDWDREKKIHKVQKSNKVAKHKKSFYNYQSEEDSDDVLEHDLYDVEDEVQYK